jgi:serine/threonine-protein kinase RsbW
VVTTTESPPAMKLPPGVEPPYGPLHDVAGFPRNLRSVPDCRVWLRELLVRLRFTADDAELVISELASNAVRHANPPVGIQVGFEARCYRPRDGLIRVEVRDWDPNGPVAAEAGDEAESGRGLLLVAAMTYCWGVLPESDGKIIFAYLRDV